MLNDQDVSDPSWTILKLLRWTTQYFKRHRVDHARAAAEILLAHCLSIRRIDLYLRYDQPLNGRELADFKELIVRRAHREPVAYITGRREFWSLDLDVDPAVLIPRPDTESLVEAALEVLKRLPAHETIRVMDAGTGSGAVVIALASEFESAQYLACDISPAAVSVARGNAQRHGLGSRVLFFVGSWLDALDDAGGQFDLVVSNPPYIRSNEIEHLQPEIRRFEPRLALDGGPEGMDCIRQLTRQSLPLLKPGGWLLMEIGADQPSDINALIRTIDGYDQPAFRRDYSGLVRVARIRRRAAGRVP